MDVYRLDGNIKDVPIEEYFDKGGVTIIEWAEMITDNLPEERLDIDINNEIAKIRIIINILKESKKLKKI